MGVATATWALAFATTVVPGLGPLEMVTDSSETPPGVSAPYDVGRGIPCLGTVVFQGLSLMSGELIRGLYQATPGGALAVIADASIAVPGSPGTFTLAEDPSCAGDRVIFIGDDDVGDGRNSLYSFNPADGVTLHLETGTSIGDSEFLGFDAIDTSRSYLGIDARLPPASTNQVLAHQAIGGSAQIVADRTLVLPGQVDPVTIFSLPVVDGETLVFRARTQQNLGIYRWREGEGVSVIADTSTPVPPNAGTGTFGTFGGIVRLDEGIVFEAGYSGGLGLFVERNDGEVQPLLLPGVTSADGHVLETLTEPTGAGSLLAFRATPPDQPFDVAIFVRTPTGEVSRLLGFLDMIDGRQVFQISAHADADTVVVWMNSTDAEPYTALYKASLPRRVVVEVPALGQAGLFLLVALLALAGFGILCGSQGHCSQ